MGILVSILVIGKLKVWITFILPWKLGIPASSLPAFCTKTAFHKSTFLYPNKTKMLKTEFGKENARFRGKNVLPNSHLDGYSKMREVYMWNIVFTYYYKQISLLWKKYLYYIIFNIVVGSIDIRSKSYNLH